MLYGSFCLVFVHFMRRKGVECREGSSLHDWTSGWQGQCIVRRRKPRRRRRSDCKLGEFLI